MKPKNYMMFMDADEGGGGGDDGSSRGIDVFEGDGGQQAPEPQQREAQPQPQREAPPTVDARQLASEFGQVIGQHFRPPSKEMTTEEAKRLLSVWEPTKEWLAKYDNLETREQAIAEQRDGMIRQADTLMRYRMGEMMQQLEERYSPMLEAVRQQEARAGEWRFSQMFPQLNHDALRPLLFSVAQSMMANGVQARNERELFTAIARGVESVIKVSNPQFSLESNGTQVPPGKRTGHTAGALPVTTPGAGGGGQRGPGPPKPRGLAVFDP
jgi:hypothetical protein